MNELFRVEKLEEITKEHFALACVAAMSEDEELKGLLGVPCGSDYLLYQGKGKSSVKVRNWSRMLELHVVSESGTWLVSSHIDGRGIDGVIDEAYRQLESAMPYIKKQCKKEVQRRWKGNKHHL